MHPTKSAGVELPEQIQFDIKTPIGEIRQLRRASSFTDSPLVNFTIGKISGQLYARGSGERVLIVEKKVVPPAKIIRVHLSSYLWANLFFARPSLTAVHLVLTSSIS